MKNTAHANRLHESCRRTRPPRIHRGQAFTTFLPKETSRIIPLSLWEAGAQEKLKLARTIAALNGDNY